jgi:hypothetical protein
MNDICLDKQPRSIYKVKLWNNPSNVVMYIFVGPQDGSLRLEIKNALQKIEEKTKLGKAEESLLSSAFGKDFSKLLGLKESAEVRFVYKTIHRDDTVGIVKNKIWTYIPEIGKQDDLYMWVDRLITTSPAWYQSIAFHLMRGKNQIHAETLKARMRELLSTRSTVGEDSTMGDDDELSFEDVLEVVKACKIKSLAMPLEFKRVVDGFLQYGYANPFKVYANDIQRLADADIIHEKGALLEKFVISKNTIHVACKSTIQSLNPDILPHFFQTTSKTNLDDTVIANADTLCNKYIEQVEKDRATGAWNPGQLDMNCFVKFLHLRFNETLLADESKGGGKGKGRVASSMTLSEVFNRLHTSDSIPFIKHNVGGLNSNKSYKLNKDAVARIDETVLNTWTESTTSGRRLSTGKAEYIMIKGTYGADGRFLTFLLFPDFHVDVKFTNSKGDDLRFAEIYSKGFDGINAIVNHIRAHVPEIQERFREIDRSILVHRDASAKLVNLISHSRIETSVENVHMQALKMFAASLYPYFAVDESNRSESSLIMSYKRIDNFANASNITVFLNKNYDHDDNVLIENLIRIFGITKDAAVAEVTKWRRKSKMSFYQIGQQVYLRPKDYNNITISITKENNGYNIIVDGVTDLVYHKRIANLIRFIVLHVGNKSVTSKFLRNVDADAFDKLAYNTMDENVDGGDDVDLTINDALTTDSLADYVDEDDLIGDDVWGFKPVELDDEKDDFEEEDDKLDEDEDRQLAEGAKDKKTRDKYVLKRLQRADPTRFGHPYSKLCQQVNNRQPIVLTHEEKEKIDQTKTVAGDKPSYVNHVVLGTKARPEKKNIYICPDVWCPLSKISMSFDQFEANQSKCPLEGEVPMDFTTKYFNAPGKSEIDPQTNKRLPSSQFQSKRYVGFVGSSQECLPCCFKTNPLLTEKKQLFARCDENPERVGTTGDDDGGKSNAAQKSGTRYILGTQFPLDADRFGLLPSTVEIIFGKMKCGSGSRSTGFITDATDCFVRKGIASPSQTDYFISCMGTVLGQSQRDILSQLRAMVTVNLFLSLNGGKLCSQFVDASRTLNDPQEFKLFKAWLTDKSTLRNFKFDSALKELLIDGADRPSSACSVPLSHSKSVRMAESFHDIHQDVKSNILRLYLIYNSFTSFQSYLADPASAKVDEVLLDIFNRKTELLNPQGINIVIIEASSENAYVICNYNLENVRPHHPYVFLIKQPKYVYEPIVRIKKGHEEGIHQQLFFKSGDHAVLDEIIAAYEQSCGSNIKLKGADGRAIYTYLKAIKKAVRFQVLDYDLMLVGFVLQERADCLFIPLRKQAPILDISIECIYVSDIIRFIPAQVNWQSAADTFKELFNLSKDSTYDINVLYSQNSNEEKQPIAFVNKHGNIIPLQKKDVPQELYLDNLNIFIGLRLTDQRITMVQNLQTKEAVFQAIKTKVLNAFANNDDFASLLEERNIEKLKKQVAQLISKLVIELDDQNLDNYTDAIPNNIACSARRKQACNGMCILDENNNCKIKAMPGVLKQFEGRIVDILIKGRDTLAFPLGKPPIHAMTELSFNQNDVLDGTLSRMVERVKTPFALLDRVLDEVVDRHVKLYPVQEELFKKDEWSALPSPFSTWFKNFHVNADRKKTAPDRKLVLHIANALSIARNYRIFFDDASLHDIMKNHYISMYKSTNLTVVIDELKNMNGSFAYLVKSHPVRTLDDVFRIMHSPEYWPGSNELEVLANLFQVHFVLLTRKTLKYPSYYRKISSAINKDDYVFLFWKEEKDESQKKTIRDSYQLVSNKKLPKLIWNLQEVNDILVTLGLRDVTYLQQVS